MMAKVVNSAAGMASHIPSVPSKVGMSSFLNSAETLSRSKSIASLFIRHSFDKCHGCMGLFLYCKDTNKRARNETFLSQKKREIVAHQQVAALMQHAFKGVIENKASMHNVHLRVGYIF